MAFVAHALHNLSQDGVPQTVRFAGDIVVFTNNVSELNKMLQELNTRSKEMGPKMNTEGMRAMQSSGMLKANLQ